MFPQLNLVFYVLAIAASLVFGFMSQWDMAVASFACSLALSAHLRIAADR
jgi:hypothetical protein